MRHVPSLLSNALNSNLETFAIEAPERMLWGSAGSHPTEQPFGKIPDDALLLDLFAQVVPNDVVRNQILVANPAKLYQFV